MIEKCACCGGWIPHESSEMWRGSGGECPGHLDSETGCCGAFDTGLDPDPVVCDKEQD